MSENQRPAAVGTAYFPEPDVPRPGLDPGPGPVPSRVRGLPRRRRPAMIALAVAMAGAGVIVSAAIYQRADHQVPVVMVTHEVTAGAVIGASDLGTTGVTLGSGIQVIPASELGRVAGTVAAVTLEPATLLAPADLTSSRPPAPGQELVAAALKPTSLPVSGLAPGDRVLVIATPGDQGQAGTLSGPSALSGPAAAVVEMVTSAPDSEGFDVVDLLVSDADGVAVADQVSTGQFALLVTKRD